jgi:hypothetical protein
MVRQLHPFEQRRIEGAGTYIHLTSMSTLEKRRRRRSANMCILELDQKHVPLDGLLDVLVLPQPSREREGVQFRSSSGRARSEKPTDLRLPAEIARCQHLDLNGRCQGQQLTMLERRKGGRGGGEEDSNARRKVCGLLLESRASEPSDLMIVTFVARRDLCSMFIWITQIRYRFVA